MDVSGSVVFEAIVITSQSSWHGIQRSDILTALSLHIVSLHESLSNCLVGTHGSIHLLWHCKAEDTCGKAKAWADKLSAGG